MNPMTVYSEEGSAIRSANAASYADWATWNTGWRGNLNANWHILKGAGEGARGGSSIVANFIIVALLMTISNQARRPEHDAGGVV